VRRALYSLLWATVLASVALAPAAPAQATGTTTSAGDQQYIDPLAPTTTGSAPPPSPAQGPPAPSAAPASTPAVPATGSARPSSRTLPYTGFNLWLVVGAGAGLIILGLALRGLARRKGTDDAH
jgi:hypothetical protein